MIKGLVALGAVVVLAAVPASTEAAFLAERAFHGEVDLSGQGCGATDSGTLLLPKRARRPELVRPHVYLGLWDGARRAARVTKAELQRVGLRYRVKGANMLFQAAARWYSWMRPPSRFLRLTGVSGAGTAVRGTGVGGRWSSARCGRSRL
jgi:hypothetical protein